MKANSAPRRKLVPMIIVNAQYEAFPYRVRRMSFRQEDVDMAVAIYRMFKSEQKREGYSRVWFYKTQLYAEE